jgi:hypothetical protein
MDNLTRSEILGLERSLLDPSTRHQPDWLHGVLADDMTEFGKSGRVYSKQEIIHALTSEAHSPVARFEMISAKLTELAPGVVLLTYRLEPLVQGEDQPLAASLRSSIWRKTEGRWQLFFHQGTAVAS